MTAHICYKGPFARAETMSEEYEGMVSWIAESRANAGTWVIVQRHDENIVGLMVEFPEDGADDMLLVMTPEQREKLGMPDEVYHALNVGLRLDQSRREEPQTDFQIRAAVANLVRRVRALEGES